MHSTTSYGLQYNDSYLPLAEVLRGCPRKSLWRQKIAFQGQGKFAVVLSFLSHYLHIIIVPPDSAICWFLGGLNLV